MNYSELDKTILMIVAMAVPALFLIACWYDGIPFPSFKKDQNQQRR